MQPATPAGQSPQHVPDEWLCSGVMYHLCLICRLLKVQTQAKQLLENVSVNNTQYSSSCHFPYILPPFLFPPSTQHLQSIKTVGGSHHNLAEEVITSLATSNNNFRTSLKSVRDHCASLHHVTFSQCDILNQSCINPWSHLRLDDHERTQTGTCDIVQVVF